MICKKCGTEFSEGIFCPMCGMKKEEVIINQEKVAEIERRERQRVEEIAEAEVRKKIEEEKEVIRENAEKKAREEAIRIAQENAKKRISSDDEDIKNEALRLVREEAIQVAKCEEEIRKQEEAGRKAKEEKKNNRRAILSLILGIASWVGVITVILPIVGGIWAIFDGCKALKGKTKYKKCAIIGIVLPILLYVLIIIICVQEARLGAKREEQLNSYIENSQYEEAHEFIAQSYKVGTLSYIEKSAQLYELQGMYDEVVDLWIEYCTNEYEPIDIPDYRINEINKYLDKYGADLKAETILKAHNLINSKEVAKAEEQAAKEAEEQETKEAEEQAAKEAEEQEAKEAEERAARETEQQALNEEEDAQTENIVDFNNGEEDWSYYESNQMWRLSYDEMGFYSIVDFPYQNSKQANKLIKFYKEVLEADESKFVAVDYDRKSIINGSMQYKQTTSYSKYRYYGEMKKGLPNGQGCIVSYSSDSGVYLPAVLGNFKNGQLDGYAIKFAGGLIFMVASEGSYKKGVETGDYVGYGCTILNAEYINSEPEYSLKVFDKYEAYISGRKNSVIDMNMNSPILLDVPLAPIYLSSEGKFKNGKTVGEWIFYSFDGSVRMEMKMDNNGKTGEGKIYYSDGTIKYAGEIKNGEYHGKGTLYREDGSVEYKGNFKNGNIDN